MREVSLEAMCRHYVQQCGGRMPKWTSPGSRGVPDRIVLMPGQPPVFVEFKAEFGVVSRHQREWIDWLRKSGFRVAVVRTFSDFVEAICD